MSLVRINASSGFFPSYKGWQKSGKNAQADLDMDYRQMILIFCLFTLLTISEVLCRGCNPPPLPSGSYWRPSPGCVGTLNVPGAKCHCWGHCGYICDPVGSGSPSSNLYPRGTCKPAFENGPSTLPSGGTWLRSPGCSTYADRPGIVLQSEALGRCRCYAYCGYICEKKP